MNGGKVMICLKTVNSWGAPQTNIESCMVAQARKNNGESWPTPHYRKFGRVVYAQ